VKEVSATTADVEHARALEWNTDLDERAQTARSTLCM
jgi:hypothetical protein